MGFQIKIQKDLSDEQVVKAKEYIDSFIIKAIKNNLNYSKSCNTKGGYSSFLRRGVLGYTLGGLRELGLAFRRISNKKRIFAIVKLENLFVIEDNILADKLNICMCPLNRTYRSRWVRNLGYKTAVHGGGKKVKMSLTDKDFDTYCTIGEIKG